MGREPRASASASRRSISVGVIWKIDETNLVQHGIRLPCREYAGLEKPKFGSAATVNAVSKLSSQDPIISTVAVDYDQDDMLLNTPGGIINLATGALMPPDPSKLMSKSTSVTPSGFPDCPTWLRFCDEATKGDKELQRLLQQMAGYSLTGLTKEQVLFFIYGDGGNGKSVFLNTFATVMGDYAATASMELLAASNGERHPTELAVLNGPRLVTVSETEEGKAWAEAKIKTLTGGDKISARFMRQDPFEFKPRFKLLIVGNHKPNLKNVDHAMMRRLRLVPFENKPEHPDRDLEKKLIAEGPGILRWAIEGCLDWQVSGGLVLPSKVVAANKSYFENQDLIGTWIEECTEEDPFESEAFSDLFENWKLFAERNGEEPGNGKSFGAKLDRRGIYGERQTKYGKTVAVRIGIKLTRKRSDHSVNY